VLLVSSTFSDIAQTGKKEWYPLFKEVVKMNKMIIALSAMAAMVFSVAYGFAQAPVALRGTPPQYIGLGEFENPKQPLTYPQNETLNPNPSLPVIKHAYAIDRGRYGTVLKIYIEAEDPHGDMSRIATTVDQAGYGHYPTDFIFLKPEYRKHFKGYIQWNTFSSHASRMHEWVRNYVTVAVIDQAGRTSKEFVFPFTFETGVTPAPQPPAPFDQGGLARLGSISIDLFDPLGMGNGGDRHSR